MAEYPDETWDDVGFALASRYRADAMLALQRGPMSPSQVAREKDVHCTHAAAAMRDLRDEDLVELRVSDDRHKHRIQGLTNAGETVAAVLEEMAE